MVARDQDHYEALAIELGNDPQRMGDLKAKLKAQLPVCDLFNTPQTVRDLEDAFEAAAYGIEIRFLRGGDGQVESLELHQGGQVLRGKRGG